ncbi:MAG TPA: molybdenum cofactor biosynthesis protein B [Myxococcota bacterium]|nr:molybdenum cofactor biosynthesis protein B [Myxococcota bacterium]
MPIDTTLPFRPVRLAVLTVSDTRTLADDTSGAALASRAEEAGHHVVRRQILPDDRDLLVACFRAWLDDPEVEVILSTGGTGVTRRDVTPEAVLAVADKEIPGFGELFRWQSYAHIKTSTIQSRALAVVASGKLIFALPGSTGAVKDAWDGILRDQLDVRHRPCNFVELFSRM